jgi:hypothetical protein
VYLCSGASKTCLALHVQACALPPTPTVALGPEVAHRALTSGKTRALV